LSWKFLMAPYANDPDLQLLTRAISLAYPVMDIALLVVAVRLTVGSGRREPAFRLLSMSVIALLVTDSVYGYLLLHGGYEPGGLLDAGWIVFYVCWGAAALHPSMRSLAEPVAIRETQMTVPRLLMLGAATMVAPIIEIVMHVRREEGDMPVLVAISIVLFLLVVVRMAGLVKQNAEQARRERALREAGAALVTATNRPGIHAAALKAARALIDGQDDIFFAGPMSGGQCDLLAEARHAPPPDDTSPTRITGLPSWATDRLRRGSNVELTEAVRGLPMGRTTIVPVRAKTADGALIIVGEQIASPSMVSLEALATQVALALDSAASSEEFVRTQSEERFAALVQNSSDLVTVVSPDTTIRYLSPSVQRILGLMPEALEGTHLLDLVHADDRGSFLALLDGRGDDTVLECRLHRRDGSWMHVEISSTDLLDDPRVAGIVLNARDISDRKAFEEELSRQAFTDSVTGLPNRALFGDRLSHALARQRRTSRHLAVLFLDIDDFKTINDSLGHAAGDVLLAQIGERLIQSVRSADTAARLGGDEFAILLEDRDDQTSVTDTASRILAALRRPFALEGREVTTSASIGIAYADPQQPATSVDELLRNGDVAMYTAKQRGKGCYEIFAPQMYATVVQRLEMKADLQRAIENDEFELHYQPIVVLETGRVVGTEALLRWNHPTLGRVSPAEFIPLAEETGLIVQIGQWVLIEACKTSRRLRDRFSSLGPLTMSVNVSARQLQRGELIEEVSDALRSADLDASALVVELTESMMVQDMEWSIERMAELKRLGIALSIDDFGTGYSSLNYIRRFPVDVLKIDKSFVDGLTTDDEVGALMGTILDLSTILGLRAVAEGIEQPEQLASLLALRCPLGQGNLFSPAVPLSELEVLLEHQERETVMAVGA
jgi:diguanylate cyclase (GGDEF)-like protein/PAS domain S-box-containing protein